MSNIPQLAIQFSYTYYSSCYCSGMKTYKYKKDQYQLRWRVNKYQFKVLYQGRTIKSWAAISGAEEYLNTLHQTEVV